MARSRVTRREFVQTGAGLVLAFYLPQRPLGAAPAARAASDFAPNAWLKIGTDGLVTLTLDKSEMGQGAPTGLAARVVGRGTSVVFSVLKRLTGVDLLDDLGVFFRALGGLVEGFKERAAGVKALLADEATTFIVIPSPEREPVEEAIFFRGKLREAGMPFGGLIVNRVHPLDPAGDEVEMRLSTHGV